MSGTEFSCNGRQVVVESDRSSLLDALRDELGLVGVKDGCSPQGQCGCCTVLVDGEPRVSCVTSVRRVAGREVTTVEGLDEATVQQLARRFIDTGASQCGFCTPGILVRLAALGAATDGDLSTDAVNKALSAHLCRCTGWQTITESTVTIAVAERSGPSDGELAARRATIEGGVPQRIDVDSVRGVSNFGDDVAPADALVAMPDVDGGWVVAETTAAARTAAGRVQGRRPTAEVSPPLQVPEGDWDLTLATSWVEPAYLETDATWCAPGGVPASLVGNGGAFGAKSSSPLGEVARALADEHQRPVRVKWTREDAVRLGEKRPPIAAGLRADGSGIIRVVRTDGIESAIAAVLPEVHIEPVDVPGPPTSQHVRAAGWAEAAVLRAALDKNPEVTVEDPDGGSATVRVSGDGIHVTARGGAVLDETVARSYCIGAAHMGVGWVTSEGLVVDDDGTVASLTIRSFGVLTAADTPAVHVEIIDEPDTDPRRMSDAVFAATAAAVWVSQGRPEMWPTRQPFGTASGDGAS